MGGRLQRRAHRLDQEATAQAPPEQHQPIGPTVLRPPPAEPTEAELAEKVRRRHEQTVRDELAAVDRHAADVARRIEALEATSVPTSALVEYRAEARQLAQLRTMLQDDQRAGPIMVDRDGRPVDDRLRAIVRMRAAEMRATKWAAAEREVDPRRARTLRRDALGSRLLVEDEMKMRGTQPGLGIMAWT